MTKEFPSMTYKPEKSVSLSNYSTAEIQGELNKRHKTAEGDFIKSVNVLYDLGYTYEGVRELLDEI